MVPEFVHLHVHSEYSILDSIISLDALFSKACEENMPAVAVTDIFNLFGMVKFYKKALQYGVKPIIGVEVWVTHDEKQTHKVLLLCQNQQGLTRLQKLLSKGYQEAPRDKAPIIPFSWFHEFHDGLICIALGVHSDVGMALLQNDKEKASQYLSLWQEYFPNRYYLGLCKTSRKDENRLFNLSLPFAEKQELPLVALNEVVFISEQDFEAHEARVCIQEGTTLIQENRERHFSQSQYFKSSQEMIKLFEKTPALYQNTIEIAKRCNVSLALDQVFLPDFPVPDGETVETFLEKDSQDGLKNRLEHLKELHPDIVNNHEFEKPYYDRLKLELGVINSMGFAGYFLIVSDFIRWAKHNDIPVGPGRGSGAGSIVAYALEITDLDPIEYDLLFERFLNPERVSMPDFDVDFCMENRDRVIDYVAEKYGRRSVSQIATFGTMAAKAVVRDVGRVLGHPYGFVDKIAKLIPFEIGITLDGALEQEEMLANRYKDEEEVAALIDLAKKLEGLTRNVGKHAGGVVIAPSALSDFTPLYCEHGSEQSVSQFDKDDVEAIGLVKFDFLGLRTLTIIHWAVEHANAIRAKENLDPICIADLPIDDQATFDMLKKCQTTAVFQLESRGMKDLIHRLQPDEFEEIIALVALFRPGPLQSGMVDDFIDRKHGRAKVEYPHEDIAPILKPTYGVILYQEQVMQIAQVLAGYTLGGADLLRRAMGKKKAEEMAKQREIFVTGSVERGVEEKTATYIFDLMEKFAGYGFNKSHSAAYALVSYQTAWLKAHYPSAFMAAVLSSDMSNTDKVVIFLNECKELKLPVSPPSINESQYAFSLDDTDNIVYGLGAIKGVGEGAIANIIEERLNAGPYQDIFEFCSRVDGKKINRRVLEALIRSGAMDCLGLDRATLLANLEDALKAAEQHTRDKARGQTDLFGAETQSMSHTLKMVKPMHAKQRLKGEKDTLGLYLSGHPMKLIEKEVSNFASNRLNALPRVNNKKITIIGVVVALRTMQTKKGDRMAFITLDDGEGNLEIAAFSDVYQAGRSQLVKDEFLVVEGVVQIHPEQGTVRLRANKLLSLNQAREKHAKKLMLKISDKHDRKLLETIEQLLHQHSNGECPVWMVYQSQEISAHFKLAPNWQIFPSEQLLDVLNEQLGDDAVVLEY